MNPPPINGYIRTRESIANGADLTILGQRKALRDILAAARKLGEDGEGIARIAGLALADPLANRTAQVYEAALSACRETASMPDHLAECDAIADRAVVLARAVVEMERSHKESK